MYPQISFKKIDVLEIKQKALLIRPFHIIHQLVVIFMVVSIKQVAPNLIHLFLLWLMLFLLMPFLFGINDYMHAKEDRKMGRKRLFTQNSPSKRHLLTSAVTIYLTMNAIAIMASIVTWLYLQLMIVSGILYGYFKHKRKMLLAYFGRAFAGMTFYLTAASYFSANIEDIRISLFVGLVDLLTHIAGDLRDYPLDKKTNVNTLPIRLGIGKTLLIMECIKVVSLLYLSFIISLSFQFYLIVFTCSTIAWAIFLKIRHLYQFHHAIFHALKMSIYVAVALEFRTLSPIIILPVTLVWSISYMIYLWADNRLFSD